MIAEAIDTVWAVGWALTVWIILLAVAVGVIVYAVAVTTRAVGRCAARAASVACAWLSAHLRPEQRLGVSQSAETPERRSAARVPSWAQKEAA
ncbi:MAG: hypothetical protein HOZ81_20260 [Streptomyces sp.]|nr:hypothetical protein [Streptomyces sp.]NUS81875.1 hypothetical protein [Streptomyces sp.]